MLDAIEDNGGARQAATRTTSSSARRTRPGPSSTSCWRCFRLAVRCGATTINVPDTVGYVTPTEFGELVAGSCARRRPTRSVISTHCHNDLGLAVANVAGRHRERRPADRGRGQRDRRAGRQLLAGRDRDDRADARRAPSAFEHGLNVGRSPGPRGWSAMTHRLQRAAQQGGGGCERVRARERHPPARRAGRPRDLRDHGPARDRAGGQPARAGQALRPARVRRRARRSWASRWTRRAEPAFARFKDLADRKVQPSPTRTCGDRRRRDARRSEPTFFVLESVVVGGGRTCSREPPSSCAKATRRSRNRRSATA